MAQGTTFMTLPPELREQVYEYIALTHTTRRVRASYNGGTWEYKTTTSAITAICRLVHNEYEDVARKTVSTLDFLAMDMDFHHIIDYFHRHVDAKYLWYLQLNGATVNINMAASMGRSCKVDMPEFYTWALFLIGTKLKAAYHSDPGTWMAIFEAADADLRDRCVAEESSSQAVRDNIEEIRKVAGAFDTAVWLAYPQFRVELQARRHHQYGRN